MDRWRKDMPSFAAQVLKIQQKTGETVPLELNAAQRIVNDKLKAQVQDKGYVRAIILKARQEGISTYTAARFFRGTTLHKGRNALVIAHSEDASEALYRIYDRYYHNTPEGLLPALKGQQRGRQMLFKSDTQIAVATAGGKEIGRALTRFYIHASEVAFWPNQIENLTAVLQTVPQQAGEVILESTANGVGDEFYNRWQAAEAGESDYLPIFLPWWIHGEYSLAKYDLGPLSDEEASWVGEGIEWEGTKHQLTEGQVAWRRWKIANDFGGDSRIFRQEFPSTAQEAFLVSGNSFFDIDSLQRAARTTFKPLRFNIQLRDKAPHLVEAERGQLRIWERPVVGGHYVIGADTATGKLISQSKKLSEAESERGGRDYSSADVVKVGMWVRDDQESPWHLEPCREQVAQLHGYIAPEVFASGLYGLGLLYACTLDMSRPSKRDPALIGVERNHSSGQTIIRWLKDREYKRQYVNRRINRRAAEAKPGFEVGWITSGQTRMPMLDELAMALRLPDDDPAYMHIWSEDTIRECYTFVWGTDDVANPKPEAQEGAHDDRVMSLGIALQMERFHRHAGSDPIREDLVIVNSPTGM